MWEKVSIAGNSGQDFLGSTHGQIGCIVCHGGTDVDNKDLAMDGVIRDPSANPEQSCGGSNCHEAIVAASPTSIHSNLTGYRTMIAARVGHSLEGDPYLEPGFEKNCNKCHTTCGQCHISRPHSVEGGFIAGHRFEETPSMINQCVACHGSRIGEEYRGKHNDEIPGYTYDIHYRKNSVLGGKHCVNCHWGSEMHYGSGEHRYDVDELITCELCHELTQNANVYHATHWGDLSCHVCHAQDYKSCDACHVPEGTLDRPSYLTFKIGKNPLPENRPYKYVTLRHIPIARDTYAGWGYTGNLPEFDSLPTWKYTSPHNIQRWTARTDTTGGQSCGNACHNSPATAEGFFLREIDLQEHPEEIQANTPVIVPDTSPVLW